MRDMTEGAPFRHLWRFAIPLLLANWLQLAYNAVDSMIAGRFIGRDALAAEGIAAPVMNLVILAISGLCIGASVLFSERFGAHDMPGLRRALGVTLRLGLTVSAIVAVAGFLLTPFILRLLTVPSEIFPVAVTYLRITFLGAPFAFVYNALSAAMKSVGDTKTPLRFLAISSVLNACLDLLLLGVFHLGIVTSAATTVIAEACSAYLAMRYLRRQLPELMPDRQDWQLDHSISMQVLRYGAPTALQQAIQPIGKVLIQGQVNALGVNTIAAFHAVTRADDFACIPEQGISSAISTYIAQNRGANKPERIRSGFAVGIGMEVIYGLLIGLVTLLCRSWLVSLFVAGEGTSEVIHLGSEYLGMMAFLYFLPGLTNGLQGWFRGHGLMHITILGTLIQISLRTLGTILLAPQHGLPGIAWASGFGWLVMILVEGSIWLRKSRT